MLWDRMTDCLGSWRSQSVGPTALLESRFQLIRHDRTYPNMFVVSAAASDKDEIRYKLADQRRQEINFGRIREWQTERTGWSVLMYWRLYIYVVYMVCSRPGRRWARSWRWDSVLGHKWQFCGIWVQTLALVNFCVCSWNDVSSLCTRRLMKLPENIEKLRDYRYDDCDLVLYLVKYAMFNHEKMAKGYWFLQHFHGCSKCYWQDEQTRIHRM